MLVSIIYDCMLLALSGWWLLDADRTPYDRFCSVFLLPILTLIAVAISRLNSERRRAFICLSVNLVALILLVFLAVFRSYWDIDFMRYGKEYSSAVQVVEVEEAFSEEDGVVIALPQPYTHLAREGEIYVTRDKHDETSLLIFPITPDDLDGLMTAYVYAFGNQTESMPEKCLSGRPVNPPYEHWYYCVVSRNHVR